MFKKVIAFILLMIVIGEDTIPLQAEEYNIVWEKTTKESENNSFYDVSYNKDKVYIVVGEDGAVVRSEDAKIWDRIAVKTNSNLNCVATDGKAFVIAGENGAIFHSKQGKQWTKAKVKFVKSYTYKEVSGISSSDTYKVNWSTKVKEKDLQYKDIIWDGKRYIAIARFEVNTGKLVRPNDYDAGYRKQLNLTCNFLLTSKDGKVWTANYVNVPDWNKLIYTGNTYAAISEDSFISSKDLKKWKSTKSKFRGDLRDIIYCNSQYMTIGYDGSLSSVCGTIHTSKNGAKWKEVINDTDIGSGMISTADDKPNGFSFLDMSSLLYDGKQYIVTGYSGMVLSSKNGKKWTKLNELWDPTIGIFRYREYSGVRARINKIIYDGEQYIEVGDHGTILVSKDLLTGVVARTRPEADYNKIVYDGESRYLAIGDFDTIWESVDGYKWKQADIPEIDDKKKWYGIVAHKGVAIALCTQLENELADGATYYFYSDQPNSWVKMKFPKEFGMVYNVQYMKDSFYVFTGHGILKSKDGKKWTGYTNTKLCPNKIIYNGKIYIGCSSNDDFNNAENALYTSKNEKKWSKVSIKKGKKKYYISAPEVVWNGKQFVTIGGKMFEEGDGYHGDYVTAFSKDGIKWDVKARDNIRCSEGAYGNKMYTIVDWDGNLYCSKDAVHFSLVKIPTNQELETIIWDGEKFLVAGEMGVILTSKKKGSSIPKSVSWIDQQVPYRLDQE